MWRELYTPVVNGVRDPSIMCKRYLWNFGRNTNRVDAKSSSWKSRYASLSKLSEIIEWRTEEKRKAYPTNDTIISTPKDVVPIHIVMGTAWSTALKNVLCEKAGDNKPKNNNKKEILPRQSRFQNNNLASEKKIFQPFGPQFGLKIRGGALAPPLDPPLSYQRRRKIEKCFDWMTKPTAKTANYKTAVLASYIERWTANG